jgi:serine protease Do
MRPFIKRSVPVTTVLVVLFCLFIIDCRFSFAGDARPEKGSVTFGAKEKPALKTTPEFESFKTVFADIADKVIPSVVSVIPTQIDTVVFNNNPFYQFFGGGDDDFGSPFDQFFGVPRGRQFQKHPQQAPKKQLRRQQGLGSGVIVSKDGYILTNYHVVHGADEIEVKTSDKRTFQATVVGVDSLSDVAVIKIKGPAPDLTVAYLGDSDKLRVGEWVMAVGNPFALTSTVTQGIVSALGRRDEKNPTQFQNYIQTDAAINPGNSGGALVNLDGELVGINTMIYTTSGGFMGIGMAIPINMARRAMEDIIYYGKVTRGWLGVQIQDVNEAMRGALGLGNRHGVLISDVFKGQPADKAGIKRGDVVLSVNGKPVESSNELKNTVASIEPGTKTPVVVFRNGKEITLSVVLNERNEAAVNNLATGESEKEPEQPGEAGKQLGLSVGAITDEARQQYNIKSDVTGVVVTDVDQASAAAGEGVQPGDVIQEVNRQPVASVKDFAKAAKAVKKDGPVLLLIRRAESSLFVAFTNHEK